MLLRFWDFKTLRNLQGDENTEENQPSRFHELNQSAALVFFSYISYVFLTSNCFESGLKFIYLSWEKSQNLMSKPRVGFWNFFGLLGKSQL